LYEKEFEDSKGVIRICISKKNRQHNGKKTEEQTTQWIKEKEKKDKQRSTKHTHKTNDRVTRTPQKLGVYSGRVSSSCPTSGTRRVNQVTNLVIRGYHI
jgi:hypothetical protein